MTLRIPYSLPANPTAQNASPVLPRRLPQPWSHGRGYVIISLLTPLVLGSVLLIHLHTVSPKWLRAILLTLQGRTKHD